MRKKKMLSPSQFAEKIGRPYQTVMTWLRKDLIEGAEKTSIGKMEVYLIPEDASYTEPSMGRPPKPVENDEQSGTALATNEKPAKPVKKTRKAISKKSGK